MGYHGCQGSFTVVIPTADADCGYGVGMLTAATENPHYAKVEFLLLVGLKANDGAVIVVVDVTITGVPTDGTGLKFGLKLSHVGIKRDFDEIFIRNILHNSKFFLNYL